MQADSSKFAIQIIEAGVWSILRFDEWDILARSLEDDTRDAARKAHHFMICHEPSWKFSKITRDTLNLIMLLCPFSFSVPLHWVNDMCLEAR